MRKRLTELGNRLQQAAGPLGFRAFVDSAPVLERALAANAGLGWIGKNTMLINRKAGSYFFLGEIHRSAAASGYPRTAPTTAGVAPPVWIFVPHRPLSAHTYWMPGAAFRT